MGGILQTMLLKLFSAILSVFIVQTSLAQSTAVLKGIVTEGKTPIPAATVALDANYKTVKIVVAGNDGRFEIRDIPAGTYTLTVSSIGFQTQNQLIVLKAGKHQDLRLELTPVSHELTGATITGNAFKKDDDVIDIKKIAQPVTVITKKTIAMLGSRRLDEVLREQTGMSIVNDLGSGNRSVGLQMQGFGSEYIMIMLNGQPMNGRFNGNFDLSRISVSDIERIEIVKGASSSLFGCEALGGVVNIITRQHINTRQGMASLQYGTYNTLDATLEGETPFANNKGSAYLSGNYYRTDGFNVNTTYLKEGKTAPPYNSLTLQGRSKYQLNDRNTINISGRYSDRHSTMDRNYGVQPFRDVLDESDLNASASLNSDLRSGTRLLTRYYFTRYSTDQQVNVQQTGKQLQRNEFVQSIHRLELQATHELPDKKLSLTGGAGGDFQAMDSLNMYNYFGYVQANYKPAEKYEIIAGIRYDGNNVYGGKVNPTFGAGYHPSKKLSFKFSAGRGFKAPTYAQLYQVFTNVTQGYTVIGANNFEEKVKELQAIGTIQQLWPIADRITALKPETSTSLNLGATWKPFTSTEFSINGFYNNIRNQIFSQQVGIMKNGQQLYSFFNIAKAFTRGIEVNAKWNPLPGFSIAAGYQLLEAKDRGVIDSIKAGVPQYSTVRADGGLRKATTSDYFNLPNRSRHNANIQLFYEQPKLGIGASLRGTYRGKYGFMDQDNNLYIDPYDVFVDGYFMASASIRKNLLKDQFTLQLTVDNILDYTDYLMPAQPGRMFVAGLMWRFKQTKP